MFKKIFKYGMGIIMLMTFGWALIMPVAYADPPPAGGAAQTSSSGPSADDLLKPIQTTGPETALVNTIAQNTGAKGTTWQTILTRIIQTILAITGSLAFISFSYAGVLMVTARGTEEQISKGKKILIWSIIALAVIATSYAIVYGVSTLNFTYTPS